MLLDRNKDAPVTPPPAGEDSLDRHAREVGAALDAMFRRMMTRQSAVGQSVAELSGQEMRALGFLAMRGKTIMSALAEMLGAPLSTVTHTIDRLVNKGLVERHRSEEDRRVVEVDISEEGRRITAMLYAERHAMLRSMMAALTPGERALYVELVGKMARSAHFPSKSA
jgi:DNA-binding MarR family transcriptional regulator